MSRILNTAYPKSSMFGAPGHWRGLESQGLEAPQDQYEVIDQAIGSTHANNSQYLFVSLMHHLINIFLLYFKETLNTLTKSQLYGGANSAMMSSVVGAPKKFRIVCEEIGFIPHTVKACIKGNMLHVIGLVEVPSESGLFTKQFNRAYPLPQHLNIDTDRLVKLFTQRGQLIIEMPIIENEAIARFGGANVQGLEEVHPNVYVVVNMAAKDEEKTFKPMGLGTSYNRALDTAENLELPTSLAGWATSKRHVLPEAFEGRQTWDSQKFSNYMPSTMSYGF